MDNNIIEIFGDMIYSYSRAQALEDGVLVDLNQFIPVNESGYKYPIACTTAVWNKIKTAVDNKKHCNDYNGIIWDILTMSKHPRRKWETGCEFSVIITGIGRKKYHDFKIECGPGDDAKPVLTIMLPDES